MVILSVCVSQLEHAARHPGLLRFQIDGDNSFIPDGGDGLTDPGLPQQLLPYASGRVTRDHAPTRGVWRRHQLVWAKPNSSTNAIGWQCTRSGAPGTWAEIGGQAAAVEETAEDKPTTAVESLERLAKLRRGSDLSEMEYLAAKALVLGLLTSP